MPIQRCRQQNTYFGFHLNCPIYCLILTKSENFLDRFFKLNIKFHEEATSGSLKDSWTDKQDESNRRFLRLCEHPLKITPVYGFHS